jgi:hypothetical protein
MLVSTHKFSYVCSCHVLLEAAEVPEQGVEVPSVDVLHDEVEVFPTREGVEKSDLSMTRFRVN